MFKNYKKGLIIISIFLILFLAIGSIYASEDFSDDSSLQTSESINVENIEDNLKISDSNNLEKENENIISVNNSDTINTLSSSSESSISDLPSVDFKSLTKEYSINTIYKVKVYDILNYNGVDYKEGRYKSSIKLRVYTGSNYKNYYASTDYKGMASIKIPNLSVGTHNIELFVDNKKRGSSFIKVTKATPKVSAPAKTVKYKTKNYFNIKVLNSKEKAIKGLNLKIRIYTGKKYKTQIIKTNSKGKITINTEKLSLGTHKVTIKSNKNYKFTKKSKITVNKTVYKAPTLVSLTYSHNNNNYYGKLTWNSKKGAKYQILRKLNSNYEVISTVVANTTKMTFTDKIDKNKYYTYSVRRVMKNPNGGVINGPYDKEGLTLLNTPSVKVDFQNLKAKITWSKVNKATKYYVFRKIGRDGKFKAIATLSANKLSYTDMYYKSPKALEKLTICKTFIDASYNSLVYTVRAYSSKTVNGVTKTSCSMYLSDGDFNLESPTIISLKDNKIKWSKVPNAEGYLILKNSGLNNKWEIIGQVGENGKATKSKSLNNIDNKAYYAIQAYANKNGEMVYSNYDRGFTLKYFSEQNAKQKILYIGDSITYGSNYKSASTRHIYSIPYRVAELLGCNYYNPSIPGSSYRDLGQKDGKNVLVGEYYRYRIFREVVDPISQGKLPANWEALDTAKNSLGESHTTIEDYNIVVLAAGTNDYLDNSKLGSIDSRDVGTFNGALNRILEKIEQASKNRVKRGEDPIKVVFVDLYYSDRNNNYEERNNRDVTPNKIGLTLTDYQNALNKQLSKWKANSKSLTFYRFKTRDYNIVNQANCPYTASDNLHFTKFTYGQYGEAFAQFLVNNVF